MARSLTVALAACLIPVVASCAAAGQAAAPRSSASPSPPPPTTIEEAQKHIAKWQAVLGVPSPPSAGAAAAEPESAPSSPPPPPAPPGTDSAAQGGGPSSTSPDACATPCNAIASMRRSVGVLCSMAGDEDARCQDAKQVLAASEQRVSICGC